MEGILYKWTNYFSFWKQRYFVLTGNVLYYYKKKGGKAKGKIHLGVSNLKECSDDITKFELNTGIAKIYLKAPNKEKKNEWIKAIKLSKLEKDKIKSTDSIIDDDFNRKSIINIDDLIPRKLNDFKISLENLLKYSKTITIKITDKNVANSFNNEFDSLNAKFDELYKIINNFSIINKNENSLFEENPKIDDFDKKNMKEEIDVLNKYGEVFYSAEESLNNIDTNNFDDEEKKTIKKFYDPLYDYKRNLLPFPKKKIDLNVWSILKDAVGKDLSKFCVPVYFNEPLSMLQRLCENFQYASLLNRAAQEPNKYIRMALTGAFCVGGYAFNIYRVLKFFNPLLSETYEYIDNDLNFRYFAEQVSHHPAISACHVEGEGYTFYTNTNAESKFFLMKGCMEFHPIGRSYVTYDKYMDKINYTKPKAVVRNLMFGKMHLDCYGKSILTNLEGDVLELEFFEEGKNDIGRIYGEIKDVLGNIKIKIEGTWLNYLEMTIVEENRKEIIWKRFEIEGNEEERFFFTDFSINLNNITEEMKNNLPPTDSRLRPDQRALEMQDYNLAGEEKHRLEEKQRKTRKEREKMKIKYKPVFFEESYDDLTGDLVYLYKGNYWEERNKKCFEKFYDIYN